MRRNELFDITIGALAGCLLTVFVMGIFAPPGWPTSAEKWATILAPAVAILVAAGAILHTEWVNRGLRRQSLLDFAPVLYEEMRLLANDAGLFSIYLFWLSGPEAPADETEQARLFAEGIRTCLRPRMDIVGQSAERVGRYGPDCAQLVLRTRAEATNVMLAISNDIKERSEAPSELDFDHLLGSAAKVIFAATCAQAALSASAPGAVPAAPDTGAIIDEFCEGAGLDQFELRALSLREIAIYCDRLHYWDKWFNENSEIKNF